MNFIESQLSRRNMMAGMATSAALVASTSADAGQSQSNALKRPLPSRPPLRSIGSLATASVDEWTPQIGTTFETSTGPRRRLADVREFENHNTRPAGLRERPFAAGFDVMSGSGALPEQLTLRVNHKVGGTFDLFVTATTPAKPLRRVAVFS